MQPAHGGRGPLRVDVLGDVGLVRRQVERVAAASRLVERTGVDGEAGSGAEQQAMSAQSTGIEGPPRDLGEAVAGQVHRVDAIGLSIGGDHAALVSGDPVDGARSADRRGPVHDADAGVELRAAAGRLPGDDVDDPTHRARAEQRGPAALGHLDAVDQASRDLLEAVDLRERRQRRLPVHQDLGVGPFESQQPDLREVAVLAVVLDADAGGVLDRVGEGPCADPFDEVARHDLGAHRRITQPRIAPLADHLDVGPERRGQHDGGVTRPCDPVRGDEPGKLDADAHGARDARSPLVVGDCQQRVVGRRQHVRAWQWRTGAVTYDEPGGTRRVRGLHEQRDEEE
jgi:hypothetical protein